MQTMLPQFTSGVTSLMAFSLFMSGLAMAVIVIVTAFYILVRGTVVVCFMADAGVGAISSVLSKVWMVAILPMVALYSGVGGGAASTFAAVQVMGNKAEGATDLVLILSGALIGAASLSGSVIAWTRIGGIIEGPLKVWGRLAFSSLVTTAALAVLGYIVFTSQGDADRLSATLGWSVYWLCGCGLLLGVLITLPICQEQMPVVIYLFNAFTGVAVALEGVVLQSPTLIIAGMLVGTLRMLLTLAMARLPVTETSSGDRDFGSGSRYES